MKTAKTNLPMHDRLKFIASGRSADNRNLSMSVFIASRRTASNENCKTNLPLHYQSYLAYWYPPFEKESAQTEGGYQYAKTDHPQKFSRAFGAQSKSPLFLLSDPTLFKSAQTEGGTSMQGGTSMLNRTDSKTCRKIIVEEH